MDALAWRVVGASVQGTAHRERGTLCQDAHAYQVLPQDGLLIAVADGAGSARRSREGARLAVEHAMNGLTAYLREHAPRDAGTLRTTVAAAFVEAREALVRLARRENLPVEEFATTLTCAAISHSWLAIGQIGDGAVVARSANGALRLVARPRQGEYANESFFLTMPEALSLVEFWVDSQEVQAIAVTTDGLLRLMVRLPGYEPHLPFFEPLLAFASEVEDEEEASEQLSAFLSSDRVCARTDDDKTLVVATRLGSASPLALPGDPRTEVKCREAGEA